MPLRLRAISTCATYGGMSHEYNVSRANFFDPETLTPEDSKETILT
jgi:hypothetical protein